jgi:uncharacterized membrane protein YfcA
MIILGTMFLMGCLLGFIGAGGAGVVIAVMSTVFGIPIHTALGTSLSAMGFTTLSGAYSHYREGNVLPRLGLAVGAFGAFGAFAGAKISAAIPAARMHWLTASMLLVSAILMYLKVFHPNDGPFGHISGQKLESGRNFWLTAVLGGLVNGLLSGTFGIGATPFIQLTLLFFFGISLHQAVGTTMLVILPIAVMGGLGYLTSGFLDLHLFAQVVLGLMSGAYLGAKFTKRLPPLILKIGMVAVPAMGAVILFVGR